MASSSQLRASKFKASASIIADLDTQKYRVGVAVKLTNPFFVKISAHEKRLTFLIFL